MLSPGVQGRSVRCLRKSRLRHAGRRHEAGDLAGKVDAGRVAEAEAARPLLDDVAAAAGRPSGRGGRRRRRRRPAARAAARARRSDAPPAFLNVMPPTVSEPPSNSTVEGVISPLSSAAVEVISLNVGPGRVQALGRAVGERRAVVGVLQALVDRRRDALREHVRVEARVAAEARAPRRCAGPSRRSAPGLPVARERLPGRPSARRGRSTGAAACPASGRAPTARPSGARARRPGSRLAPLRPRR